MNKPAASSAERLPPTDILAIRAYNARMGLVLFVFYLAAYVGFVVLSASEAGRDILQQASLGGVSVGVLYGFGLIAGAFVTSIIYMLLCKNVPANS